MNNPCALSCLFPLNSSRTFPGIQSIEFLSWENESGGEGYFLSKLSVRVGGHAECKGCFLQETRNVLVVKSLGVG